MHRIATHTAARKTGSESQRANHQQAKLPKTRCIHQSPFTSEDCQSGQAARPPESQGKQSRSGARRDSTELAPGLLRSACWIVRPRFTLWLLPLSVTWLWAKAQLALRGQIGATKRDRSVIAAGGCKGERGARGRSPCHGQRGRVRDHGVARRRDLVAVQSRSAVIAGEVLAAKLPRGRINAP